MSAYTPRDGSIAQRVIWHCEHNGASSSAMLCELDGVTSSNLPACLATAIRLGALFVRKIKGESWYHVKPFESDGIDMDKLGRREPIAAAQTPVSASAGTEDLRGTTSDAAAPTFGGDDGKPLVIVGAVTNTPQGGIKAKTSERQAVQGPVAEPGNGTPPAPPPPATSPGVGPMGAGQAADAAPPGARPFSCALFSDGRLLLNLPDQTWVELDVDETRVLCHYLDRLMPEETT